MILRATSRAVKGRATPATSRIPSTIVVSPQRALPSSRQSWTPPCRNYSRITHSSYLSRTTHITPGGPDSYQSYQWRAASNKAPNSETQPAQDAKADSPWTEEPRSPAPGQDTTTPPPPDDSTTQPFRSKLRQENIASLEQRTRDMEQEVAKLKVSEMDSEESGRPRMSSQPLPDLRQGIPSAFDPPTSDSSSSFQAKDSEPMDLNITADPATGGGRREDETPREEYVSSIEQRRLRFARWMYIAAAAFGAGAFGWLGREWQDDREAKAHPDAPNGLGPMAWYARFTERLSGQFSHYTEPAFGKLLPDPPTDPTIRMPYTLVISLEDLLVHSEWSRQHGYQVAKRPGVDYFLRYLCQYYELVIFTTVQAANGDMVIRQLDPYSLCLPIFRDGTRYINGEHVKDLSYLNRPLDKTLLIDTNPAHASLQPENGIILPKWSGRKDDPHTTDLVALIPFLEYIAGMELPDVRRVLASYHGKHIPTEFHKRETKAREEFQKRLAEEKARRGNLPGAGALKSLSGALGFKSGQGVMRIPGEQDPAEAFAEGKMLSDQIRERGQRGYKELERNIRENGEMWLKMRADEEKKAMDEGVKNMTGGIFGMFASGGGGGGGGDEKK